MEPKCEYTTLHLSSHGYIIKCGKCCNYQLAFGNLMFSTTEYEYGCFKKAVAKTLTDFKTLKGSTSENVKNITLQIYYQGVSFILNYIELELLADMIHQADSKEMVFNMLNYSKN